MLIFFSHFFETLGECNCNKRIFSFGLIPSFLMTSIPKSYFFGPWVPNGIPWCNRHGGLITSYRRLVIFTTYVFHLVAKHSINLTFPWLVVIDVAVAPSRRSCEWTKDPLYLYEAFRNHTRIGQGSFGMVYKVTCKDSDEQCAIKVSRVNGIYNWYDILLTRRQWRPRIWK